MRGLNLSALANRGRAAEGLHSAKVQAEQAKALRKRLSDSELAALRSQGNDAAPTVDILGSISAQSALSRLAVEKARASDLRVVKAGDITATLHRASAGGTVMLRADPPVMRALGSNKYALYQKVSQEAQVARPLPGSEKYGDGAALGMASASVATAIVGSVGISGIGLLYFNPAIVDRMKMSAIQFREHLEGGIGERLRALASRMRRNDSLVSQETLAQARSFARKATKVGGDKEIGRQDRTRSEDVGG